MARPTKFTKERADRIIDLVKRGNFKTTAARAAKVDPATLDRWIVAGRAGKNKELREFCAALEEAEALAEIEGNDVWREIKTGDAVKERMRRRFSHWNVPDKAEVKQEITEDVDTIDARVNKYFAERKRRGISGSDLLRDDTDESVHTDNAETDNADSETGDAPKE